MLPLQSNKSVKNIMPLSNQSFLDIDFLLMNEWLYYSVEQWGEKLWVVVSVT
jgi:hypothetical protein